MGSTQSSSDTEANPREIRRRTSRLERNKSFSHQSDRNKTVINDLIVKDILASIQRLINQQPISLNYILQDIESKLNEASIGIILVTLLTKQGLKNFSSDPLLDTNSQNESIVQDVIQQTMIDLFLIPFYSSFETKSSNLRYLDSQDAKQLLFEQLKNDVQNFNNFCLEFFSIIIKKINLKINKELIKYIIQETIFRPSSIDDIKTKQKAKQFINQYYQSYELYYSFQEQQFENFLPLLEIAETSEIQSIKQNLIQNKQFSECEKKMKKIFQKPQSSNFMSMSEQIYMMTEQFNNQIYQMNKNMFRDGADSRQVLNINFITLFYTPGFYTSVVFIQDNFENLLQPLQRHLITTLCISFEHLLYYIREQAEGNQMNMQTQASLGEMNQCQSIYINKQYTIS